MKRFNYLIIGIINLIFDLINNNIENIGISISILDIIILFFYILGSLVYLEFIELNFCGLNVYTRRNIKIRSESETIFPLEDYNTEINDYNETNENYGNNENDKEDDE